MSVTLPQIPAGSGRHPIALAVISANRLEASGAFYTAVFGWQMQKMSAELLAAVTPAGPATALRSGIPDGFPGIVPYLATGDVGATLAQVTAGGGAVERAPWKVPMVGTLARFRDPAGTIYGLTDTAMPGGAPKIPMPFGSNPKPPVGALCSLEMYAGSAAVPAFFQQLFGWGTIETMPSFVGFDAGAGIGGVFQSHTPALPAVGYVYVADVAATLTAISAAGGAQQGGPMAMPGMGTFGYFTDPSGTTMGLIGP